MVHILVVDDDAEDRFILSQAFTEIDTAHTLSFVEDGSQIFDFLANGRNLPVDLIVLDLNMPRVNGVEALRLLQSHDEFKQIPVAIFSTSAYDKERDQGLASGALSFTTKPSNYIAYVAACRSFLAMV